MKVALYLRTSTERQRDERTIESQRLALVELVTRRGDQVVAEYVDDGHSGATIDAREAFRRLLVDALADPPWKAVVVTEWSRLTRGDLEDVARVKRALRSVGIKIITPGRVIDPDNADDDFLSDVLAVVAKRERREIIARTQRGKRRAALEGRNPGVPPPFGYQLDRNTGGFVVDVAEAEVVRRVFDLAVDHGIRGVAELLMDDLARGVGVPPRRTATWSPGSVRNMLRQRAFIGELVVNRMRSVKVDGRTKLVPRDPSEQLVIEVPAIVTREQWEAAQRAITFRQRHSPKQTPQRYLLAGLIRCEACGYAMVASTSRGGSRSGVYRKYGCYNHKMLKRPDLPPCALRYIAADDIEQAVWATLEAMITRPEMLQAAVEAATPGAGVDRAQEVSRLRRVLERRDGEERRLLRGWRKGLLNDEDLEQQRQELAGEREFVRRQIETLEQHQAGLERRRARAVSFADAVRAAPGAEWTWERQREVLMLLCSDDGAGVFVSREADRSLSFEIRGLAINAATTALRASGTGGA